MATYRRWIGAVPGLNEAPLPRVPYPRVHRDSRQYQFKPCDDLGSRSGRQVGSQAENPGCDQRSATKEVGPARAGLRGGDSPTCSP